MNIYFWVSTLLISCNMLIAQSDKEQINSTINSYIKGTSYNQPEMIEEAFYKDANLFLSHKDKKLWIMPIKEYTAGFAKKERGKFNGRKGNVLSIDVEQDIATAKAEILISGRSMEFIDIFLLKKIEGHWKIISKAATRKK